MSMDMVEVTNATTWCQMAQQEVGVGWHYQSSFKQVGVHYKRFLKEHPEGNWTVFGQVILWAKDRRFKPLHVGALAACWPYAVDDKYIQFEDLQGYDLDDMIYLTLEFEDDPQWRRRLMSDLGTGRTDTYEEWKQRRREMSD